MKHLLAAAVCATAMTGAAAASTVTIDFVALAAGLNPAFGNVDAGDYGDAEGQTFSFGALDVTLTSTGNAYLDDLSGGNPGGLGVCSTGITGTGQCDDASDDNVTSGEAVTLSFSGATVNSIVGATFNDGDHIDISDSTRYLGGRIVDDFGPLFIASTFAGFARSFDLFQVGPITELTLSFGDGTGTGNPLEFYLSSLTLDVTAVPLPASVLLLGGAVGGLGLMRRRRKAAA